MKLKPINDKILVREIAPEEKTEAGIILTKATQPRQRNGKVLDVGKGHRNTDGSFTDLCVKSGNKVIFNYANGNDVECGGEKLQMIREADLVAIIEE